MTESHQVITDMRHVVGSIGCLPVEKLGVYKDDQWYEHPQFADMLHGGDGATVSRRITYNRRDRAREGPLLP